MDLNQQKEQFSNAYLRAVVAVAGYTCYKPEPDTDSVDWGIAAVGGNGTTRSPRVELQLKCTSQNLRDDNNINFPLKIKNYNDLKADNYQVPRILVVVIVPDDVTQWLTQTEDSLALKHCGYWISVRGRPDTDNEESVTIKMSRTQLFSVESLGAIMKRVGNEGLP